MVGSRDSSLGIKTDIIVKRWKSDEKSRNELETGGVMQFCSLLIDIDTSTGRAKSVFQVIKFV
jgi:calcineurin-like phosphoesterase